MQAIEISPLRIRRSFGRIQILRIAIRIERAATKCNRSSLHIKHREDNAPAKSIVRTAFILLYDQPALLKLLLRRTFLTEMGRERVPTVERRSQPESIRRFLSEAALLQIMPNRGSGF